jgi:DNA invertase Pin-like site-specific DNA recombinase
MPKKKRARLNPKKEVSVMARIENDQGSILLVRQAVGGGRYKLSKTQQEEAIKRIRLGEKSQAEIAELFNVDRSTVSRMMKEVREKELLKAAR